MKKVKIISKNEKGTQAIKQHLAECSKLRWDKKMIFKKLYNQEVIQEEPYTLMIEIKDKKFQYLIRPKHFIQEIDDALLQNGAFKDIDYIIEVEE